MKRLLAVSSVAAALIMPSLAMAKTIKIGMIHWIAYSPLNVAEVKGIWKKQGLDVQVTNFGSNQELNTALEQKKIDIALDMIGSWVGMINTGTPLTILGETDWSNGGDKIIAKKDIDLGKLKGQTIGVYLNQPSVLFFLNKYLAANKLKLSDIKIIEQEPEAMSNYFISNKMSLIVNYDPQALRAEREGAGKVVATSATYPGVIPEGFVSRSDVYTTIPKADLVKVFKGWAEAVVWSKNAANWKEYKEILNSKTFAGEKPYSEADLKDMIKSVSIHSAAEQKKINNKGGGLSSYMTDVKGFMKENNLLKNDFSLEKSLDTSALIEALGK